MEAAQAGRKVADLQPIAPVLYVLCGLLACTEHRFAHGQRSTMCVASADAEGEIGRHQRDATAPRL